MPVVNPYCKNLPQSVQVQFSYTNGNVQQNYSATFQTTDAVSNPTYCYKTANGYYPHFTIVDTGGGNNRLNKFHYRDDIQGIGEIYVNYVEASSGWPGIMSDRAKQYYLSNIEFYSQLGPAFFNTLVQNASADS